MTAYTFSDVLIKPKYSDILSRKEVDVSTKFGNINLGLPVISANMKTITGAEMAYEMQRKNGLGILHRFNSIPEAVAEYQETMEKGGETKPTVGVSIGVKDEDKERFDALYENGARIFCIDVAHGHHISVKNMLHWINSQILNWGRSERLGITIIAGNIATGDAAYDLSDWGADVLKVGIGPGSVCQTRNNTGVGVPQLYALEQVRKQIDSHLIKKHVIADGGIKTSGDIAKALKFADTVMLGSFFAGCMETPGRVYRDDSGKRYKVFSGSASEQNKTANGQKQEFVEGMTKTVPLGDHVKYLLKEIKEGLQSSFSYVGARNLEQFKQKCEFEFISGGSKQESKM